MKKINLLNVAVGLVVAFSLAPSRALADGKATFDKNCKKCHAEDGTGKKDGKWLPIIKVLKIEKNPEGLNILSDDAKKLSDDEMLKVIMEGKEDKEKGKMKGMKDKVTEAEAKELIQYVHTLQKK